MSSKATVSARVIIVYRLLLLGLDRPRILEHIAKKYPSWKCSPRMMTNYMAKANVVMEQAGEYERPLELGRAVARFHDLFARCYADKDYRGAAAMADRIVQLMGLSASQAIEITDILSAIDAEIRRKRRQVEELERQYALESTPDQGA